ncbi:gamma-tubulin complex component 4-like [Pollicipes pollicipes]|uniref:gamma-tubulin complex component 4-like n=1 Tax=Pollicipes pollicipes TaxID=41117 RepID=UPI00188577A2|nr:gamma-tubulin complex component 4-like [Pollicipes pollicipes]XP_037073027.1 gamma-tubulin complex component 4-like [Pollicipes pollicipes]XP_037073028.1 gamma-tubulin complex component 4-like [Pollicipes pollicipes]XP_037073029.1 gamma-tubulin complex component 4-like [Pollicipes pollicipes]
MLHELLLALEGCTGSLFTLKNDKISLDASLPFFHPCERSVLNELCSLGTWYRRVRTFVDVGQAAGELDVGKYRRALCRSLDQATAGYEACLQRLEEDLLEDPDLGVAYVFQAVQPHSSLLRALCRLLADAERPDAAGCRLLDVLHRHVASAVGDNRWQLQLVLQRCYRVLLAQLSAWLLHGLLPDAGREFFVREREYSEPDGAVFGKTASAADRKPPALIEFELDPDLLPSYLPLRLCQSILFVGNSIQMCRQRVEQRDGDAPALDIVGGREREFADEFDALAAETTLSPFKLEQLVNKIKALVAKHLWRVIVVDAGLGQHLVVMKTFFLLGRGSLFQELFAECDHILRVPPKAKLEADINEAFLVACGRVGLEEEAVLDSVYLSLAPAPSDGQRASGWDRLRMNYLVPWPLHLLYTPAVLVSYNEIFSFLLLVKRTQIMLQRLWAEQMRQKTRRSGGDVAAHQLRAHMAFLVNNLQYYLHVDVLESEHSRLQAAVAAAEDYEQLRHAHDCFLSAVSSQCFLQSRPVIECLRDLLSSCQELCGAAQADADVTPLQQRLQRKSQLLFRIMSSLKDQRAGSHLSRLLLRIDFNEFISHNL